MKTLTRKYNYVISKMIIIAMFAMIKMPLFAINANSEISQANSQNWRYTMPYEIYKSLHNKDIKTLATTFNATIEISLPQGVGVYSQNQAEMVLTDFFSTLDNCEITIDHEKSVGESTSTICTCKTSKKTYRIYVLTQNKNIQQLRIEEQND